MTVSNTATIPDRYTVLALGTTDSTNAEAVRRLNANDPSVVSDTVLFATRQTAGKGRRGRDWSSPDGNLYCSFILRPNVTTAAGANAGYVAALAISDVFSELSAKAQVHTKWPNDVLINNRKASGVLLESTPGSEGLLAWLVVGIGINICHFPSDSRYPATSLHEEGIKTATPETVLSLLVSGFDKWYAHWTEQGFRALKPTWLERVKGLGDYITVRLENDELSGMFAGIDDQGGLLLRQGNHERSITAGDVFFPNIKNRQVIHASRH